MRISLYLLRKIVEKRLAMKKRLKIAVASPKIRICDPECNAKICAACAIEADAAGADVIVFPELALTGATLGDLYFQETLIDAADLALASYIKETAELSVMSFIGLPVAAGGALYNGVACVSEGEIIGISISGLKTRHFDPAPNESIEISVGGIIAECARDLVYTDKDTGADIFVKVGDDNAFSADGVNLILNPTATAEYVGLKAERRSYAEDISRELGLAFVMAGAGVGESGTDGIYAGARVITQYGKTLAEAPLFDEKILYSEIDLDKRREDIEPIIDVELSMGKFPFIPSDEAERREACKLSLEIQARSLAGRIERSYSRCAVIGVSGGLDSTLAVLVAAKAMDFLGRDRRSVIAITMPCFGTTERTKGNALALAKELGCSVRTIDIKNAVNQHFADISHDVNKYDVVYENAQARERTQILMDVANAEGGLVVGTGDLSELALGFATYNGDHMSMYCVNGSVPKTLMREIISNEAREYEENGNSTLSKVLSDIVNTPVSPELLPAEDGENKQHTEKIVGPYELHDFFLYYTVKFGYSPKRVLELAAETFTEYERDEIKEYLEIFVKRFYSQQFKRSCLPDGPRVTEISLSPRGAWQMPSDVSSKIFLETLEE